MCSDSISHTKAVLVTGIRNNYFDLSYSVLLYLSFHTLKMRVNLQLLVRYQEIRYPVILEICY